MKGVYIDGLREERVISVRDAYMLLLTGLRKKKMFQTFKNS